MSPTGNKTIQKQSWYIFILLSFIWGSSFILIKKGLIAFDYFQVGALRILISAIALTPLVYLTRKSINKNNFWPILGVGIFGSGIPPFLFALAQSKIDSGLAGMLNTITPLFAFILGVLIFKAAFSWNKLLGVLIGLLGAGLIIATGNKLTGEGNNLYGMFIILGAMCYATSVNIIEKYLKTTNPATITAWSFFMMSGFALVIFLCTHPIETFKTEEAILQSLVALIVLSVVCTAFANLLFFRMTQQTDALFASTITYTIPIVALFWGVVDGEQFHFVYILGMILILTGVFITSKKSKLSKQ